MGALTTILVLAGPFLVGIAGNLIAAEVYAYGPWIADAITQVAVRRLPLDEQARHLEEWRADNLQFPGHARKVVRAVGYLLSAFAIASELRKLENAPSRSTRPTSKAENARRHIQASFVGLALLLSCWLILNNIDPALTQANLHVMRSDLQSLIGLTFKILLGLGAMFAVITMLLAGITLLVTDDR